MNSTNSLKANTKSSLLTFEDIDLDNENVVAAIKQIADALIGQFGQDPSVWDFVSVKNAIDTMLGSDITQYLVANLNKEAKRGSRVVNISTIIVDVAGNLYLRVKDDILRTMYVGFVPKALKGLYTGSAVPLPTVAVDNVERLIYTVASSLTNSVAAQYIQSAQMRASFVPSVADETSDIIRVCRKALLSMAKKGYTRASK